MFLLLLLAKVTLAIVPISLFDTEHGVQLESPRKFVIKSVYNEGFTKVITEEASYEFLLDLPSLMQQNYSDISLQNIPASLFIKPSSLDNQTLALEIPEVDIISVRVPSTFVVDPKLFYWELAFAA